MRKLLLLTITVACARIRRCRRPWDSPSTARRPTPSSSGGGSAPAPSVVERAAITKDRGDQASVARPYRVGRSFYIDVRTLADLVILLATTALIFALGAVGVEALWIADRKEFLFYGVLTEPPYVLPDQPLHASYASTEGH